MQRILFLIILLILSPIILAKEKIVEPNTYAENLPSVPQDAKVTLFPIAFDFAPIANDIPLVQQEIISLLSSENIKVSKIKFDETSSAPLVSLFSAADTINTAVRGMKEKYLQQYKQEHPSDIYLIPQVVIRSGKLSGQSVIWDHVKTKLQIKGFGSGPSSSWSGNRTVLSLSFHAYDSNGNWIFTSFGGISDPYTIDTSKDVVNQPKVNFFEKEIDKNLLAEGVKSALDPLVSKLRVKK